MTDAAKIVSVGTALAPNYITQDELTAALRRVWVEHGGATEKFDRLQRALGVRGRFLAMPLGDYPPRSFAAANKVWSQAAPELCIAAATDALERAHLEPSGIDHIFFISVTGIAAPSIDAVMANRLGMRRDIKRTPIFGLGCAGGVSGVARAADYLRAFPDDVALVVTVELCSLTIQPRDLSPANMIASGLFGDGAAAAVIAGAARKCEFAPRIAATRSILYPNTEHVMGWEVIDSGFKIVLSAELPDLIRANLRADADSFLSDNGLSRGAISHWIAHPGGPGILRAVQQSLEIDSASLAHSWRFLKTAGNLSSASVLFVMRAFLDEGRALPGDWGVMLAMGPGFSAELALLQW
ncbi:MAG: type III polyketide synthase [Candidatus Binataceae bacterium]